MRGKVYKSPKGWVVNYEENGITNTLPLHPDSEKMAEDNEKITFKIVEVYKRLKYVKMALIVDFIQNPTNVFQRFTDDKIAAHWIFRKFCNHEFISHRVDDKFHITCVSCGQQYISKN